MLLTTESTFQLFENTLYEKKDTVLKSANRKFNSKSSYMNFIDSKYLNKCNDY